MDPLALLLSVGRVFLFPALLPLKLLEARLTTWDQTEERERKLNRKVAYLRTVALEYGYEPGQWQFMPYSTEAEIGLRNFLANVTDAANKLGDASRARRGSQKFMTLASLDAASRRIDSAVRSALVSFMNEMIPYKGKWSLGQTFPDYLMAGPRPDPVNLQSSDKYEQLAAVVTIKLWEAREHSLDEEAQRNLAEYLNRLNASR